MQTNKLIERLVDDLKPVRPLWPLPVRLLLWGAVAAALAGAVLVMTGLRREWAAVARNPWSLVDCILVLGLAFSAAWGAFRFSIPGEARRWNRTMPLVLFGLWAGSSLIRLGWASTQTGLGEMVPDSHFICALIVFGTALAMVVPLVWALKRAAPMDVRGTGLLAGFAAAGSAMMMVELICLREHPAHIMAWHVLPVIVFAGAVAAGGSFLFRQRSPRSF